MLGVDPQAQRDLDRLVELDEGGLLREREGVGEG